MWQAGYAGDSSKTAGVNSEEGGDDVKSSCPLCPGLHACYNGRYKGLRCCKAERIPKSRSQFGLGSATRPHEVGVASNRRSEPLRRIRPRALPTPPVASRKSAPPEAGGLTRKGGSRRRWGWRLGRSRNKVAVPEGAAGSPPFSGAIFPAQRDSTSGH